jgi:hypothetical protein
MAVSEVRSSSPWLAFTGLLPVLLMVPILIAHAYAAGVIVAVVGCVGVVVYHLVRGQGITSLDLLALVFAVVNVVLYFGLGNTWLIGHIAIVFYTLLALQSAVSLFRGDPWTMQFTRRVVRPEVVADPRFRRMNTRTTVVWVAAFAACDVLSVLVHGAAGTWLPAVVLALAVVISRVSGHISMNSTIHAAEGSAAAAGLPRRSRLGAVRRRSPQHGSGRRLAVTA